jgi:hypothetical protein
MTDDEHADMRQRFIEDVTHTIALYERINGALATRTREMMGRYRSPIEAVAELVTSAYGRV